MKHRISIFTGLTGARGAALALVFGGALATLPLACGSDGATSHFDGPTGGAPPATGGASSDGSGASGAGGASGAASPSGAGGGSSTPGAGGAGSSTVPNPSGSGGIMQLPTVQTGGSPSGASFDWPESDGGSAQNCKAGRYLGTFTCTYRLATTPGTPDAGGLLITGPVELTLAQSQDGEFLEVSGGTLDGLALIAIHFKAGIRGKLDCSSGVFQGTLENGSYAVDPFPAGGTFTGPMTASTTMSPPCSGTCLNGTWALNETGAAGTNHIGTCAGTWTATLQP
jgi:hypothetical protein